jgi:aldehyde:ferredoxin oxidoreductase
MPDGYMGNVLEVDLSSGRTDVIKPDDDTYRRFLGGYGLGARLIFDRQQPGADPLEPESYLGFFAGPFTGTPAISGTRFTVCGKSPLTGGWGDANSGGYFAAYLKFAGYDGILVKGVSEKPVYLYIDNGKAEIRDASGLWGKDTYETDDLLKAEHGKDVAVACIGEAGEKRSLIAGIVHTKGSVAARSGLGAVMGAKQLKAVAVKGTIKVPLHDEARIKEMRKDYLSRLGGELDLMRRFGTTFTTIPSIESGDAPVKNYKGIAQEDFPDAEPLDQHHLADRKLKRQVCYQCPVGCEALLKGADGEYTYEDGTFRPEYETLAMLGSNCLNNNLESVIKANDLCNRHGLDTISAGAVVAFAMECWEHGLITEKDTGGLDLTWGNHRSVVELTDRICRREGIGDLLADGVMRAAEKIGGNAPGYAMHVGGQEIPGHNPIATPSQGTTYLSNATPARHTQGSEAHHGEGLLPEFDPHKPESLAKAYQRGSDFQHILACTGMCLFVNMCLPHVNGLRDFLNVLTGWDTTLEELVETGERIAAMRQAFNVREGQSLADRSIAGRMLGKPPFPRGPLAGVSVDAPRNVREYLKLMKWDETTGFPDKRRLEELGLGDVARQI